MFRIMISKNRIKLIRSLDLKKNRRATGLFVAEGPKVVGDLLPHFRCEYLAATAEWAEANKQHLPQEWDEVTRDELARASFLRAPQQVIALFNQPDTNTETSQLPSHQLCLALDDVQDPGNLGTIVRLADWFGIEHIFCSLDTADIYNPKTVQATMGAVARVHLHYQPLDGLIASLSPDTPVYGTFLNGSDIYKTELEQRGLIVLGNEGNGISPAIESLVTQRLYIPNYPEGRPTSESLNVAVATAVVCSEFRRRG